MFWVYMDLTILYSQWLLVLRTLDFPTAFLITFSLPSLWQWIMYFLCTFIHFIKYCILVSFIWVVKHVPTLFLPKVVASQIMISILFLYFTLVHCKIRTFFWKSKTFFFIIQNILFLETCSIFLLKSFKTNVEKK